MTQASIFKLISAWRRYRRGNRGVAAAEFAIILPLLVLPLLNAIDLGIYVYDKMELTDAAQVAAQEAWVRCAVNGKIPATVVVNGQENCPDLAKWELVAAHSLALGANVSITSTTENFYCLNSAGGLVVVGNFPDTEPADCSAVKPGSTDAPGDYVLVTTSYTYTPVFSLVSVAANLPTPITQTAWMRLD